MNKRELIEMINDENTFGYLATADGDQPKVRPISAKYSFKKLLFATFAGSDKTKQLKKNSKIEMAWTFPDLAHARFEGTIAEVMDNKIKRQYLEEWPLLKECFSDENDPKYTLLEIKPTKVQFNDLGEPDYENVKW